MSEATMPSARERIADALAKHSTLRIGSMFTGAGGLDLALHHLFPDSRTIWTADVCKIKKRDDGTYEVGHHEPHRAPCNVIAHRFPDAANLGDVSLIDWTNVERPDVICAGFPCTDLSVAGGRAGLREGTRSGLWSEVVRAIVALNPRMVFLENVPGIYTAPAVGDMEPCTWCVGDDPAGDMRALDAVLADVAAVGFDAEWVTVPASGVGAAHKRERWFCLAWPASIDPIGGGFAGWSPVSGREAIGRAAVEGAGLELLPTPVADHSRGLPSSTTDYQSLPNAVVSLLPTPAVNDMGSNYTPETWDEWTATMKAKHGNGNGHGKSLNVEAQRLLHTPRTGTNGGPSTSDKARALYSSSDSMGSIVEKDSWGKYAAAIARQERAFGTPAPAPTDTRTTCPLDTKTGDKPRLSCAFDEWLMGYPPGWMTDVPGVTHNEVLRMAGNGVVWQQAAYAYRLLLGRIDALGGAA